MDDCGVEWNREGMYIYIGYLYMYRMFVYV